MPGESVESPTGATPAAVVIRFFREIVDSRDISAADEILAPDVIVHRAGHEVSGRDAVVDMLRLGAAAFTSCTTTIHSVIADGPQVAAHITHDVVCAGPTATRLGRHGDAGARVTWEAMARFHIEDGRIAEEWVLRDEMAILLQLGVVAPAPGAR